MDNATSRSRWAALGAAVAVALGAGGIGITHAALGSGERTAYVPINPCRLADSRPGTDHVGSLAGALAEDASVTLDAHGAHGNCDLPSDATGLALNVTAVNQTQLTYLTFWPADAERPKTSNLNPAPGQPPTPNAVTVDLDAAGRFSIYNRFGSVDIVVDVVGYYADHHHDDRYYTKADTYTRAEVDAALALKADAAAVYSRSDIDALLTAAADKRELRFELLDGETSEPITLPDDGTPTLLLLTLRDAAPHTALVLLSRSLSGSTIQWTTIVGGAQPTRAFGNAPGTPIMDFGAVVCGSMGILEVGPDLTVQMRNPSCLDLEYVITVVS